MDIPGGWSFYRGYSRNGIGEGPGRPVEHGEQYLAADEPLSGDGALLATAANWMTLDASPGDYRALDDRFEAWSYFGAGDLRVVVRLTAADRYDVRKAYFAHGRAWPSAAFSGSTDPGTLLGCPAAFEAPWREGADRRPFDPTSFIQAQLPPPVEPQFAAILTAHLYQACMQNIPVLVGASTNEFVTGGAIHALVRFARAALPLQVKRDCRIRIYTRATADLFATDLGAHLIVLPEDVAATALAARRDATLIDRAGTRIAGHAAADAYLKYGEAVVTWSAQRPDGLLRFAERVARRSWSVTGPTVTQTTEIPFIYTAAAVMGDTRELDAFVGSLFQTLETQPVTVPWAELLTSVDLSHCSEPQLLDLLLAEPRTDEGRRLQQMAATAGVTRGVTVDSRFAQWWATKTAGERVAVVPHLFALLGARLVSTDVALRSLDGVPDDSIATIAVRPDLFSLFAGLTDEGRLSPRWCAFAVDRADPALLVQMTTWLLGASASKPELNGPLRRAMAACHARNVAVTPTLAFAIAQLRPQPRLPEELPDFMVVAELLHRAGHPDAHALLSSLGTLERRDDRRAVLARAVDPAWTLLAGFQPPNRWTRDIADLSITRMAREALPSIDVLARLGAELQPADHETRQTLIRLVDASMKRDLVATTDALIGAGQWLSWRLGTGLTEELRNAAFYWVVSPVWRQRRLEPTFEEWRQVIKDLRAGLLGPDAQRAAQEMPLIRGFEPFQRQEIVSVAPDLQALAMMAPAVGEVAYKELLARVREFGSLTEPFVKPLIDWAVEQPDTERSSALWTTIEQVLTTIPVAATSSLQGRGLAVAFRRNGLVHTARALDPSLDQGASLVDQAVRALREGDRRAACWGEIAKHERGAALLGEIADRIGQLDDDDIGGLDEHGAKTFIAAAQMQSVLLQTATFDAEPLPAMRLLAVVDSRDSLGAMAVRLALCRGVDGQHLWQSAWWQAIFEGLGLPRRSGFRSAADCRAAAVALLWACMPESIHETMRDALGGVKSLEREVMPC